MNNNINIDLDTKDILDISDLLNVIYNNFKKYGPELVRNIDYEINGDINYKIEYDEKLEDFIENYYCQGFVCEYYEGFIFRDNHGSYYIEENPLLFSQFIDFKHFNHIGDEYLTVPDDNEKIIDKYKCVTNIFDTVTFKSNKKSYKIIDDVIISIN